MRWVIPQMRKELERACAEEPHEPLKRCQRGVVRSNLATPYPLHHRTRDPVRRPVRQRGVEPTEQMIFLHSISIHT